MRPMNDWVLVELEEEASRVTDAGIILTGEDPVRMGKVLAVGPGRRRQKDDRLEPSAVKEGERVAFFIATQQTLQGKQIVHHLPEGQGLIKESDILMVDDAGDTRITR